MRYFHQTRHTYARAHSVVAWKKYSETGHLVVLEHGKKHKNGYNYATRSLIDLKIGMRCPCSRCQNCLCGHSRISKNVSGAGQ